MGDLGREAALFASLCLVFAQGCDDETDADAGAPDTGISDAGGTDAGVDSGPGPVDAGGMDAGGDDAGATDAGATDAGATDAGATDAGTTDSGAMDAGAMDAGATDAGATDAGFDAGDPPVTPTTAGDLVITEIQYSPGGYADDGLAEWLEIYNPSSTVTFNLVGCSFADRAARVFDPAEEHIIATDLIVAPGAYVTVASNDVASVIGFTPDYSHADSFGLSAGGEDPAFGCGTTIIDVVDYAAVGFPSGGPDGTAISLHPASSDAVSNDTGSNWCYAVNVFHTEAGTDNLGTPGAVNPACPSP